MLYKRIYSIAVSLTAVFVFFCWSFAKIMNSPNIAIINDLISFPFVKFLLEFLLITVSIFGLFKISVHIMIRLIEKCSALKKNILRSSYFEGKWVGYYYAPNDGKPVLFYQIMKQAIEYVNIETKAYNAEDMSERGFWKSVDNVYINPRNPKFSYQYLFDSNYDETMNTRGTFTSTILHESKRRSTPWKIEGYALNHHSKKKFEMKLIKVFDSTFVDRDEEGKLLQEALEFYKISTINQTEVSK